MVSPDNVWTDAGDARVCIYCMTLGASWNANLDTPLDPEEVDATLDKATRDEFRKAIERDNGIADRVIKDAAEAAESGIIKGITISTGGEPLTVLIEREATRRLAEARARAAIVPGRMVPGFGRVTEGVIFEPTPEGRLRPQFVSVVIAQGRGYRVLRRRGRYLLQTSGGRAIATDESLALLLLLFAALEKARRDEEARTRELEAGV